jgi:hypothetical protein
MNSNKLFLQYIPLFISIISTICSTQNYNVFVCSNGVAVYCLFDLCFLKRRDMILHHIFVLMMAFYMNTHRNIPMVEIGFVITNILFSEISTNFLIIKDILNDFTWGSNVLLENILKKSNKICFVSTFFYFRLYKYSSSLILNKEFYFVINKYSHKPHEMLTIYGAVYGLLVLNIYWAKLIFNKCIKTINQTQNM